MGQIHMERANPFGALVADLTADKFLLLREAVDERRCREDVSVGTLAEAAAAYRPDPGCPECGAGSVWRDGFTAAGVPRWRCLSCGRRFNSLTGTVLEHCRKPLPVWFSFIRLMRHNVPVECAAELCGVTHKTAFEWRHRVLATVSGYQDRGSCCGTSYGWTRPTSTAPTPPRDRSCASYRDESLCSRFRRRHTRRR